MIPDVTDHQTVAAYVREVKRRLEAGRHDDAADRAARRLGLEARGHDAALLFANELPDDNLGPETEPERKELFVSRDPLVSLVQTTVEAQRHRNVVSRVWQAVKRFFARFTRKAVSAGEIADGMLERLIDGTHDFNPVPAQRAVDARARFIVVGDWGSGLQPAQALSGLMAQEVQAGLEDGREVHVIHLGDVYFTGEADEYRRHVLADGWWPVTNDQAAAGVGSWSLAGNHDLYGGARAYFAVLLGDPRFHLQRSVEHSGESKPTSWFRLTSPFWDIIGLDTAWNDDPFERGQVGLLEDPQAEWLRRWIAEDTGRKRLVLSHHQYMTVYDSRLGEVLDRGELPKLHEKLNDIVSSRAITAWIWGHEHRCMAYEHPHVPFPRCLGHGGQLLKPRPAGRQLEPPGKWLETASFPLNGETWGSLGFAILDLEGPTINVRYRLATGQPVVPEEPFA